MLIILQVPIAPAEIVDARLVSPSPEVSLIKVPLTRDFCRCDKGNEESGMLEGSERSVCEGGGGVNLMFQIL